MIFRLLFHSFLYFPDPCPVTFFQRLSVSFGGFHDLQPAQRGERFAARLVVAGAQRRAVEQAVSDMTSGRVMNRLCQGDVGSGKTVVAAGAVWLAAQSGWQSALMAPTEILAAQHYQTLSALFEGTGIRVGLLTGSMKAREKRDIRERLELDQNELELFEHSVQEMETDCGMDRNAALADMRYNFIESVCRTTVVKCHQSRERMRSEAIDRVVTNRYLALPIFFGIMVAIFFLTFNVIGDFLSNLLAAGIDVLTAAVDSALTAYGLNPVVHSLVIDGIFAGVGSVLSFLPIIVVLFFFLSILEDTGYMARVAFVMDKPLRKIGLSGRSIVPMLIGFGCTVPAVMSTRTLPSERDRKMTILLTPFMSCSAKLPIYAFFTSAFFPEYGALVMCALYLTGIVIGILVALLYRKTLFRGDAVPFVMELPNYRLPGLKNVMQLLWEKAKDFLQKAFTVIFVATICIWFLQKFDLHFNLVADSKDSILAMISNCLVPIFAPLGLGDWRICTSLISGVMAKESVISTLEILFGGAVKDALTPVAAASLLVFSLLYTPCIAAIASIRRELGRKWAVGMVIWQCMIAWVAAFAVRWLMVLFMR